MSPGSCCLVLFSLLLAVPTNSRLLKKKQLTVGYMTAVKGELKDRQGLAVSGALALALEEVSPRGRLLPVASTPDRSPRPLFSVADK